MHDIKQRWKMLWDYVMGWQNDEKNKAEVACDSCGGCAYF